MEIIGHTKERALLRRLSERGSIPQSYLFAGPRGVGKREVALEFASLLIGAERDSIVRHPDLLILAPAREEENWKVKKKRISIGDLREASLFLSRYPTQGKRRVLLIDEAEELTTEASNALLKILEEPNETSILILVTHRPGILLQTVLSRLLVFSFGPVPPDALQKAYRGKAPGLPDFFFSLGLPGLIERSLSDKHFSLHKEALASLFRLSALSSRERLKLAEKLSENEEEAPLLLEEWLMGLHARVTEGKDPETQAKLLLLFETLTRKIVALTKREGNTRLLLEDLFFSL